LDFKGVVLPVVVSYCLGNFIKEPLLLSGIISPSSEVYLSVSVHLGNSVEWKFRDNVEWSVDVESKFFIQSLSLSLDSVNIDNLPSLVGTVVSIMDLNGLSFNIFISNYIKTFSILPIDKVFTLILEDLPPL
jgi:hypothetical protein